MKDAAHTWQLKRLELEIGWYMTGGGVGMGWDGMGLCVWGGVPGWADGLSEYLVRCMVCYMMGCSAVRFVWGVVRWGLGALWLGRMELWEVGRQ